MLIGVPEARAEFRVATVDVSRVLNESKEAQAVKKKLDDLSLSAKKKLDAKRDALTQLKEKLESQKVSNDSKEAEGFQNQVRDFERSVKDSREDLQKEFMKSNKALTEKTLTLVQKYASSNKIDLVLDKGAAVRGPVLYAGQTFDITEAIIKQVNN